MPAVVKPLCALTKKEVPFDWIESCQESFVRLKELLTTSPILVLPDFQRDFMLETDASGQGLGAVLAQKQEDGLIRPIAFASRTLQPHERNYGITELESLGVVWAMKHAFLDTISRSQVIMMLLNTPHPSGKLARLGLTLQEFMSKSGTDLEERMPVQMCFQVIRCRPLTRTNMFLNSVFLLHSNPILQLTGFHPAQNFCGGKLDIETSRNLRSCQSLPYT